MKTIYTKLYKSMAWNERDMEEKRNVIFSGLHHRMENVL